MKKLLYLIVAAVLVFSMTACNSQNNLEGVWTRSAEVDPNTAAQIMIDINLGQDELSLVTTPLYTVTYIMFNADGTFCYYREPETEKQCVRDFYKAAFDSFYEGREYLCRFYKTDFMEYSKEDFIRFYTDLYEVPDYDALIEKFVNAAYDYEAFGELISGSYTAKNGQLTLTTADNAYDNPLDYTIQDGVLTLVNGDITEVYTKK